MRFYLSLWLALAGGTCALPCLATDYNEAVSGDLSNLGLAPTAIGRLTPGSNSVFGTTGRGAAGLDRDYFTITIPAGYNLVSLTELPGTTVGGNVSFLGVQAGTQVTVPSSPSNAVGLLGWTHYGSDDILTNLLPRMGVPSLGSTGFSIPLAAGEYSFWIQDFNAGRFTYGFDFGVQAVPEPGSLAPLLGIGTGAFFLYGVRRRNLLPHPH